MDSPSHFHPNTHRVLEGQVPTTRCKHGGLEPLNLFYEQADKQAEPTATSPQIRVEWLQRSVLGCPPEFADGQYVAIHILRTLDDFRVG